MLERMFPKQAKKMSRLIGLWKDLLMQKVAMMRRQPTSDRTEQTLSTTLMAPRA